MSLSEFLGGDYLESAKLKDMYSRKSVLGVSIVMNCGMACECIAYRNSRDMDVRFEDGTVVRHCHKDYFLNGKVAPDSVYSFGAGIVGKRVWMTCGDYATCIRYAGNDDTDIRFDDGVVLEHIMSSVFLSGSALHPKFSSIYVGQSLVIKKTSQSCVCVSYACKNCVAVELDNGEVLYCLRAVDLSGWTVDINKHESKSLVGVRVDMNCGLSAVCIADRGYDSIDIEFEDGAVVTTRRNGFLSGSAMNPCIAKRLYADKAVNYLGMRKRMNCGYWCTVIADRGAMDIDIQFECDGTVVQHRRRDHFMKGAIAYPGVYSILGQRRLMNCGYYGVVVRDGGAYDIDVMFEVDGFVVKHERRDHFKNCSIVHPKMGTLFGQGDSMCQRILYYYLRKFYSNVGYSVHPVSLSTYHSNGFEIDIMLWDIKTAVEFDGSVPHHFDFDYSKRKRGVIEASDEIDKLFVVRDRDNRIVKLDSPKTVNISLSYTSDDMRYYDTYEAAKLILEELGHDVSSLSWEPDILPVLYKDGIVV